MKFVNRSQATKVTGFSYLGDVNSSPKLKKNGTVSQQHTYGLYLAPAKLSGYNTCLHSTPECRMGCLNTSGYAGIEVNSNITHISDSRINKTKLFYENPEFFMAWMIAELDAKRKLAATKGFGFSARLNCTSDIDWQNIKVNNYSIFERFPDITFYDYTKNPAKFINKPDNYHLTFSYTGRNWKHCEYLLKKGHNVAMVFDVKDETQIPDTFQGFKVVNGDITDYRVDDAKGIIVGLKWKRIANRENEKKVLNSCFVVKPESTGLLNKEGKEIFIGSVL